MKVIATVEIPYDKQDCIVQISSRELTALLLFQSTLNSIAVTRRDSEEVKRSIEKLESGDTIDPDLFAEFQKDIGEYQTNKDKISKSMASLRGSLTRFDNVFKSKGVEL